MCRHCFWRSKAKPGSLPWEPWEHMVINLRLALRIRPHTALLSPGSSLWLSRSYSSWLSVHPGSVYYSLSSSFWALNFIAHNHCTMLLCYIRTFLQKYGVWWAHPSILPLSPFHTATPLLFCPIDSLTNFMSYIHAWRYISIKYRNPDERRQRIFVFMIQV